MARGEYALTFTAPPAAVLAEATPTCYEAELLLSELLELRLACEARMAAATPLLGDAKTMQGYLRELQASCGQPSAIATKPPVTPPATATELRGATSADSPMQHSTASLPHLTAPPAAVLAADAHVPCEASLLRELAVLRAAFDARDNECSCMGPAPVLTEASLRECLCELRQLPPLLVAPASNVLC